MLYLLSNHFLVKVGNYSPPSFCYADHKAIVFCIFSVLWRLYWEEPFWELHSNSGPLYQLMCKRVGVGERGKQPQEYAEQHLISHGITHIIPFLSFFFLMIPLFFCPSLEFDDFWETVWVRLLVPGAITNNPGILVILPSKGLLSG